jgi:hypothetical protein
MEAIHNLCILGSICQQAHIHVLVDFCQYFWRIFCKDPIITTRSVGKNEIFYQINTHIYKKFIYTHIQGYGFKHVIGGGGGVVCLKGLAVCIWPERSYIIIHT